MVQAGRPKTTVRRRPNQNFFQVGFGLFAAISAAGALLSFAPRALAALPQLADVIPNGAQRGTECPVTFQGERLQDAEEVLCYQPGIQVVHFGPASNNTVQATLKIAPDCPLGEHHLRLRTATGLSEIRTFWVGPFPAAPEAEPNDGPGQAQKVGMNITLTGVVKNEDVDCFAVELKKDEQFSADLQGMRLGRSDFDPRLTLIGPNGAVVADSDDTWLGRQDPMFTFLVPTDGVYVLRVREAAYRGGDNYGYRLHLGAFPRPAAVFPLGGQAGQTNSFEFIAPGLGTLTNLAALPASPRERFGIFAEKNGLTAPTPNWVRVSPFPNVLASGTNLARESATSTQLSPPVALNGVLSAAGQEHWFGFPAQKGIPLNVAVFARRLHSPLDAIIDVLDPKGQAIASNDDSAGADSVLKFTPPESTNFLIRIRDTLGQGGSDFVYRIEVFPDEPALALRIPEVARNDTQSRQFIAVPRGNRVATLLSARRANFGGELSFGVQDLPAGVSMSTNRMAASVDTLPVVFEATPDAPVGGKLVDFLAHGASGTNPVTGRFSQNIDLVMGPNNSTYYSTVADRLCVAVTKEVPFKVRIVEPRVPLVQAGSMALQIEAERAAGFDAPIDLQMVWNPPGVSSQPEITIAKGATNAAYHLNASAGAETRTWKIAVLASAPMDGGRLYVSSQLADLEVAAPYLTGKIETLWINPGQTGKLTVNLQPAKPFEGKAKIRLMGLPEKVTAAEREIGKDDQEVVFDVVADPACGHGSHRNLFAAVNVPEKGSTIYHVVAPGGILRVVPPKKAEPSLAGGGKQP